MISILMWILLGFLAGLVAKMIMPGSDGGGFIYTTVLGIVGAMVGGFIGVLFGYGQVSSFNNIGDSLPSFIFSVIGAIVILAIFRVASSRVLRA